MPDKAALRTQFQSQRQGLSSDEINKAALTVKEKLINHAKITKAQKIGAYLALGKELNLIPTLEFLKEQNKEIFVPILHPLHQTFWFAPWHDKTRKNKYGIDEPVYQLADLIAPWDLDVVLVPLVAIDQQGHRLGMGKGYYDRSFAFKKINPNHPPYLIATAYQIQLSETELPHHELDIIMDEVILV